MMWWCKLFIKNQKYYILSSFATKYNLHQETRRSALNFNCEWLISCFHGNKKRTELFLSVRSPSALRSLERHCESTPRLLANRQLLGNVWVGGCQSGIDDQCQAGSFYVRIRRVGTSYIAGHRDGRRRSVLCVNDWHGSFDARWKRAMEGGSVIFAYDRGYYILVEPWPLQTPLA